MTSKQLRCLVNRHYDSRFCVDVYKGTRAKMRGWFMHPENAGAHVYLGKTLQEAFGTLAMLSREKANRQRILSDWN